jgi:DNA-binding transcriptional ArsR family regulator
VATKRADRHRGEHKRKRERKQRKTIEEAVQYALSHPLRLQILIVLNEGSFTASEVADLTGIELQNVSNHLKRMLEDGAIEVAKKEERRGTNIFWYRAVEIPEYTREEAEDLTEMERQLIAGVIVQSATAEVMAALWKRNLADPRTILSWDLYDLDGEGREKMEAAVARHLEELKEIQCESVNRVAVSKEETTSMIVNVSAFERARKVR